MANYVLLVLLHTNSFKHHAVAKRSIGSSMVDTYLECGRVNEVLNIHMHCIPTNSGSILDQAHNYMTRIRNRHRHAEAQ